MIEKVVLKYIKFKYKICKIFTVILPFSISWIQILAKILKNAHLVIISNNNSSFFKNK